MRTVCVIASFLVVVVFTLGCSGWRGEKPATDAGPDEKPNADKPVTLPNGPAGEGPSPELAAAGRKIYDANNCVRCHSMGGPLAQGGPPKDAPADGPKGPKGMMPKGPDLGHVGANHDSAWIAAHIRDPQSHKPNSRMPKYPDSKINDNDLKILADYLGSLK